MKKIFSIVLVIAILAAMMVGCGGAKGEEAKDEQVPTKENPVKITYKSLAWLKAEQDMTKLVIDEWNKQHPEIQVEYVQGDWGTVDQELLTSFETGDVPDIFHYWTAPIMTWKQRGFLADLNPMLDADMKDDVKEVIWDIFTTEDGKTVALPYEYEVDVIFYNKTLFEEKGITIPTLEKPWSLDDLKDAAKKLNDPDKGIYGVGIAGLDGAARFVNDTWATKLGVSILQKDGDKYSVNIPQEYKDLIGQLKSFAEEGLMPSELLAGGYDTKTAFLEGKLAMITGIGCWMRSQFINESEGKNIEWGMLPPIKIKTTNTYGAIQTLSIPEKSKNKDAAMEFLKYYWNTENQAKIAESAFIFPGRNSASEKLNKPENGWDLAYESVKNLVIPNYVSVPGWGNFMEGTGATIYQEYMTGQISWEEFEQKLTTQLAQALNENAN